jgi:hypothetical protein
MNSIYFILINISVVFIGFIILCKNNNLESFYANVSDASEKVTKWIKSDKKLYHNTWCKYIDRDVSNPHMTNKKDFIADYGNLLVNSGRRRRRELTNSNQKFKDICSPDITENCVKKVHDKFPHIISLQNHNNKLKYYTNNDSIKYSKHTRGVITYKKECLKDGEECGKYNTVNQQNSAHCLGPI